MINRLLYFSVYNRWAVIVFVTIAGVLGWSAFQSLPIDAVPDVTNVQVQINTAVQGLSPEETERNITQPLESSMRGLPNVTQVRSLTRFDLSQVTVVFEDWVDIYRARQLVSERLASLVGRLPKGVQPMPGPVSSGLGEIYHYAIEAEKIAIEPEARKRQLMDIKSLQDWYVKPRLITVPGVADVNTIGGFEKQYHIEPNPKLLARYGLHFGDLTDALERTNRNVGGGYVQQTADQFLVQAVGMLKTIEEIIAVPIRTLETFKTLTIGDVATVEIASGLRSGAAIVQGHESVVGTIMMLMGENSRAVATRVRNKLNEIESGLPPGYHVITLYDRSDLVNATIKTVEHNLLTGALLVIVVLSLLIGNLRAAFITALSIPLTLLVSFIAMKYFGISGNLMSLGALDFGIIVDGTVILLDHCVRVIHNRTTSLGRSLSRDEVKLAVYEASTEIRKAAGFGELIIVVVFLPIFALIGVEGKMFRPMAATFIIAILFALTLSFTLAPALASFLLTGNSKDKEPFVMRWLTKIYEPVLKQILLHPKKVLGLGLAATILGGILFLHLGGEFLPQLNEGSTLIQCTRPVNVSLDQSIAMQQKTEEIISQFPEVALQFSKIGTSEIANDPMGVNDADNYVIYKNENEWPQVGGHKRTKDEVGAAMIQRLNAELPGQALILSQPIQMRFDDLLEGSKSDVAIKVFGDDLDKLAALTHQIGDRVGKIRGAGDISFDLRGTSPLLRVTSKPGIMGRLGLPVQEILEAVGIALGGQEAGFIYEGSQRYPLVVRLKEDERSNLDAIRTLPVGITQGATAPLESLADVHFVEAYGAIGREQGKRRAAIMINPRGRDVQSFVREAKQIVADEIKLPSGYFLDWAGTFQNLEAAKDRLLLLAPLALVLVLMMIYAAFRDATETVLIFACVPMALVGGVLGLITNGLPFSISAGVGFIALSGIAVMNGVVLMNCFNDLKLRGLKVADIANAGALQRLRPVLMTAIVDIFGFLPMMLSHGVGAEIQRPLASVVIGGVISSTALTLVVLPTLYHWLTVREYKN